MAAVSILIATVTPPRSTSPPGVATLAAQPAIGPSVAAHG
jgi:hypothetical protein